MARERLPTTLAEAAELFEGSTVARAAFGDEVVEHYLNNARVELTAFNSAVTDWERRAWLRAALFSPTRSPHRASGPCSA